MTKLPKDRAAITLLRNSYMCEFRNHETLSQRTVLVNKIGRDSDYADLLKNCKSRGLNAFHVISVAFSLRQIGDASPTPTRLFDPAHSKEYVKFSELWTGEQLDRLITEWNAAKFTLEDFATSLGITLDQAALIAMDEGRIPVLFGLSVLDTEGAELPDGYVPEALRWFCISPAAYIRAESATGFSIPQEVRKYGEIARWVDASRSN